MRCRRLDPHGLHYWAPRSNGYQTVTCPGLPELHDCGYIEDSFACRIRHIHLNTGVAKAAND